MTSFVTIGYTLLRGPRAEIEHVTIDLSSLASIEAGQEALDGILDRFHELVNGYYDMLIEEV